MEAIVSVGLAALLDDTIMASLLVAAAIYGQVGPAATDGTACVSINSFTATSGREDHLGMGMTGASYL